VSGLDERFRKGFAALQARQYDEAEKQLRRVLREKPSHVPTLNLLGAALVALEDHAGAEPLIRRAIALDGGSDAAFYNHGIALKGLKRPQEALDAFNQALARNPRAPETWNNRGTVHNDLGDQKAAIADFNKALEIAPNYADALANRAKAKLQLEETREAVADFQAAVQANPRLALGWLGLGRSLAALREYAAAVDAFQMAQRNKPDLPGPAAAILDARLQMCDWTTPDRQVQAVIAGARDGTAQIEPFSAMALPCTPADHLAIAQSCATRRFPTGVAPLWTGEAYGHKRLRIAYLSPDYRQHAMGFQMPRLFELHDRERFEVIGVGLRPGDGSAVAQRIEASFDRFETLAGRSDIELARWLREAEIDIAVDLAGYTAHGEPRVFAHRPTPVSMTWLGFPGTLGASCVDYLLADSTIIPPGEERFYSEAVVRMPHSYQVNDDMRPISPEPVTRAAENLPEGAPVLACFNNAYKITPEIFAVWMRILARVPDSVLWLYAANKWQPDNLRKAAAAAGIDPARIVFAQVVESSRHTARQHLADLFLDTPVYNGHGTTSFALWGALPVLTVSGPAFQGRVAASLLKAIGMPDMIMPDFAAYEDMAVRVATDPQLAASLKAKLAANRLTTPLFDSALFTRQLESAYEIMAARAARGEKPSGIDVPA
jgi:predicted O-linked N-acetylglucosamine transferase (SPINDLY family)